MAKYALTWWTADDIIKTARENDIPCSYADAEAWLRDNEEDITGVMIAAGWDYINNHTGTIREYAGEEDA